MSKSWRSSYKWTKTKRIVKVRDQGCVICGRRNRLEVHHINDASYHPELRFDLSNLETLCYWCHRPMYHILFKGGTRKKTTKQDMRKFKAMAKYFMKRGAEDAT